MKQDVHQRKLFLALPGALYATMRHNWSAAATQLFSISLNPTSPMQIGITHKTHQLMQQTNKAVKTPGKCDNKNLLQIHKDQRMQSI